MYTFWKTKNALSDINVIKVNICKSYIKCLGICMVTTKLSIIIKTE